MSSLIVYTAPSAVLTAAQLRAQARVDAEEESDLLLAFLAAASRQAEEITGRPVGTTVYELRLDSFPAGDDPILLPRPKCVSIDLLSYRDQTGSAQTIAGGSRQDDVHSQPARIFPAAGSTWPATWAHGGPVVTVRFTAGTVTPEATVLQALRLAVGDWFEHREATVEGTVSRLPNGFERLLKSTRFRSRELERFLAEH